MVDHIISECSKLAQNELRLGTTGWKRWSSGNCARNWNLTKLTNGIYSKQNEAHKIIKDFEIETNHLIPARRPDRVLIKKKKGTCNIVAFCHIGGPSSENKRKWKDVYVYFLLFFFFVCWFVCVLVFFFALFFVGFSCVYRGVFSFFLFFFLLCVLALWVEFSPIVQETGIQSQVESY